MDLTCIPAGPQPPEIVHAVIEIPRGSKNKYEYDPALGVFRLDRVLYSSMHYPAAYGFIPSTRADDGDCVDILVMTSEATFTGCLIEARPIGVLRMRDGESEDEKVLAVPTRDPRFASLHDLTDVAPHVLKEIEHFFRSYKELEGKVVATFGWQPRTTGLEMIRAALTDGPHRAAR